MKYRFSIIACARWESECIAEWIQYHEIIGFDHIYLYCNDDDPSEMHAATEAATTYRPDFVTFVHFKGQGQQVAMYHDALRQVRGESEWISFIDIDEFLVLRDVDSIHAFMDSRVAEVDSVHFNWLPFGHNGFVTRPRGSILRQYTDRAPALNINTKHLTRVEFLTEARVGTLQFPFWHGLPNPVWDGLRRTNVIGADMAPMFTDYPKHAERYLADAAVSARIIDTAVVNHYALKSEADFLLRARRGTAGQFAGQAIYQKQFEDGSFRRALEQLGGVTDTYLQRFSETKMQVSNETQDPGSGGERRIQVKHKLWTDDLLLSANGRLKHAGHGTLADYRFDGDTLIVAWDNYPADRFVRRGREFVQEVAEPTSPSTDLQKLRDGAPTQTGASGAAATEPKCSTHYRNVIVTTARWEHDSIVEWLLYHRSIGFEHVYVYCNDDDPVALYDVLLPFMGPTEPFVTFVHFGLQGQQRQMLLHYLGSYRTQADWVLFLDVDEFLCLAGINNIAAFMRKLPADADCIYFNWIIFGPSGFQTRPSGSVLLQYTQRQRSVHPFTKVFLRTAHVTTQWVNTNPTHIFWHDIGDLLGPLKLYNALGEPCYNYYLDFPDAARQHVAGQRGAKMLACGIIYHYSIKSAADFQRRVDRGTKGEFSLQKSWKEIVDKGEVENYLKSVNECLDTYLADYWRQYLDAAWKQSVIGIPNLPNLALGRPALQSSVSEWSVGASPEADAANAVNGRITSRYQCHTALEEGPWWQVDLGQLCLISEMRIFNRLDMARERLARFEISLSQTGTEWISAYRKTDGQTFGGADGFPFVWRPAEPVSARFVRLTLTAVTFLNLDQVEIFGKPG